MKMLFDTRGQRYEAIVRKHARRLPVDGHPILVRQGWYPLVEAMLDQVARDHPTVVFSRIQAGGGWLRVDVENQSRPFDPRDDLRLSNVIQGFVTQSLSTCEDCGSHHGRHVDATAYGYETGMNRTLCEECVPVFADLAIATLASKNKEPRDA
ncbi:hypothetical protein ASF70_13085 [Rhizobium sp. Leaf321]|uniref:hypothetical protein n=1 Tax=Rhizobium sp. Leaf321 TaxID=1736335 RepID=UPI000713E9B4|nr:hypothetical protein [Rhizobium sp. Leaf321]KQQ72455.1 hypothetical protein ASF70_13085 [Rhizobium sp. Leaf321]